MLKNFWGITGRTLIKICKEHPWVKRIKVIQMKGYCHWRHWLQNKSSVYMYMYWFNVVLLLMWAMISKGLFFMTRKREEDLFFKEIYDTCIINMTMHPCPQDPHLWTFLHVGRCFFLFNITNILHLFNLLQGQEKRFFWEFTVYLTTNQVSLGLGCGTWNLQFQIVFAHKLLHSCILLNNL